MTECLWGKSAVRFEIIATLMTRWKPILGVPYGGGSSRAFGLRTFEKCNRRRRPIHTMSSWCGSAKRTTIYFIISIKNYNFLLIKFLSENSFQSNSLYIICISVCIIWQRQNYPIFPWISETYCLSCLILQFIKLKTKIHCDWLTHRDRLQ